MKADSAEAPLSASTTAVLAAAGIPPSKLGASRASRLSAPERDLYTWILRRFATRGRPASDETRAYARRLGVDGGRTLETLAREDLVHLGADGEITVAYPFSGRPTAHRVRFPTEHGAYAMCAIDALGVAPMVDQPVEIASRDPLSGEAISVRVAPALEADWSPASAVVAVGALEGGADSCSACCPVVNFFASRANADRWLGERPGVSGEAISMREAILTGHAVFSDMLREP